MGLFRLWLEDGALQPPTMPIRKISPVVDPSKFFWGGIFDLHGFDKVYKCLNCNHIWDWRSGLGEPDSCPRCGSFKLQRTSEEKIST